MKVGQVKDNMTYNFTHMKEAIKKKQLGKYNSFLEKLRLLSLTKKIYLTKIYLKMCKNHSGKAINLAHKESELSSKDNKFCQWI